MAKTIWIIKLEGNKMPILGVKGLGRTTGLVNHLVNRGYDVVLWSSSFNHATHVEEHKNERERQIGQHLRVVFLHSPIGYKKNISIGRILLYMNSAIDFEKYSKTLPKPDFILSCWPSISLTRSALKYGKKNNVPVLVDVRDEWPDIFERAFPEKIKFIARFLLKPFKKTAAKLLSQANGITATTLPELNWACEYAGRKPSNQDRAIYIGKEQVVLDEMTLKTNLQNWSDMGITDKTWNICFFSTLGTQLDLDAFISAMRIVCKKYPDIRLVIGGKGDDEQRLRKMCSDFPNVFFAGYLNGEQMASMMSISKCGAYCLKNTYGFVDAFSNKVIQYLSGGLPVLNSLQGLAKTLLSNSNAGITYDEGDAEGCAKAIEYLYEHETERAIMGNNALNLYREEFDLYKINSQFEEHILKVEDQYNRQYKA